MKCVTNEYYCHLSSILVKALNCTAVLFDSLVLIHALSDTAVQLQCQDQNCCLQFYYRYCNVLSHIIIAVAGPKLLLTISLYCNVLRIEKRMM